MTSHAEFQAMNKESASYQADHKQRLAGHLRTLARITKEQEQPPTPEKIKQIEADYQKAEQTLATIHKFYARAKKCCQAAQAASEQELTAMEDLSAIIREWEAEIVAGRSLAHVTSQESFIAALDSSLMRQAKIEAAFKTAVASQEAWVKDLAAKLAASKNLVDAYTPRP
jgi:chromosome segregation ATPase